MRKINKYLVYNENQELLVFFDENRKIIIPKIIVEGVDVYETNPYFQNLLNILDKNSLYFLKQTIKKIQLMESINYKLVEVNSAVIRNFYSCYKEFSKEEIEQIIIDSEKYQLIPDFVSFDEFKQMINDNMRYNFPIGALEELEKKLNYKKY